jgi:outer membrane protein OmpA-like peptidoglycan-associated protein
MFDLGQLDDAADDFGKALKMDPTFIDAQIQWANVKNKQAKLAEAKAGYERALAIDSAYETGLYYSLGIVEFDMGQYGAAAAQLEHYLKIAVKISPNRKAVAEKYLRNAAFADQAYKHPVPFNPVNLGPNINTKDAEYLPTLTADGEALIYTAFKGGQEDFYRSEKLNGEWQPGKPIEAVNTPNNEGAQSISADGKLLVFTACHRRDGLGGCDLFYSELKNGKWTAVKNIGAPINTPGWESQPSLASDGNTLYFAAERRGGKGGKDIWVSHRMADGKWGSPENLQDPVNSPGDEQSPFIHADGQTLYFMSNGHPGMGGFDLYLARKREYAGQPTLPWGIPQNLGYPINTQGNEGALSVSLDGQTAFFATDIASIEKQGSAAFDNPQGKGETDIYSFELPENARPNPVTYVKATVRDAATGKPVYARVEFFVLQKENLTGQFPTKGSYLYATSITEADGEFLVTLPAGGNYALNVSKEKYLFYSENFALTEPGTVDEPFKLDIALLPVPAAGGAGTPPVAKPIVLKNIFFETGSAALLEESRMELARLKKLLDENPALKIQINGHTDDVGSEADNLRLSEDRAKAVHDHLTQNGIDANRLKYKGFGETAPATSNDTEEGRRQNRRTEYVIIL